MLFERNNDGSYILDCIHDPNRTCCLQCQSFAAEYFISHDIPRNKWPLFMQDKFKEMTKESIEDLKNKKAPLEIVALLKSILNKLENNRLF